VRIFQNEELAATKLRALYQRSKGRDLFDLWLMFTFLSIDSANVLSAFEIYRPDGYTAKKAIENLESKLSDATFRADIDNLISAKIEHYDIDTAADMIIEKLLSKI
jgi:predicted nucleotidyltransferase component of viral defense system